ncbi:MAG: helix-turn-helix domain-containing protein [Lachnospiraceae bacterium]|nr:helix-turn-helix domain-containing protein [Ruminococcus sp.]MCM1276495.1 helix-turn-helix domain-containing protein [Lachnospiraceae bacterium]
MTNTKREEIIATMSSLLEQLVESEPLKAAEPVPTPDTVEMLTVKECCEVVKWLNEYTVRQLVAREALPFVRCGQGKRGKILIPRAELLAYFSGRKG